MYLAGDWLSIFVWIFTVNNNEKSTIEFLDHISRTFSLCCNYLWRITQGARFFFVKYPIHGGKQP